MSIAEIFLHFLFPISCPVCGRPGVKLCPECRDYLPAEPDAPLPERVIPTLFEGEIITRSINGLTVYSAAEYEGLARDAVRTLKHKRELGRTLGEYMARKFGWCDADFLIPVPLHLFSKRGFNQAYELAQGMSDVWGKEINSSALWTREVRHKDTITYEDFRLTRDIWGKKVALVDDLCSSGRTLSCFAQTCRRDGAEVICAYTFASEQKEELSNAVSYSGGYSAKRYKEMYVFFSGEVITRQLPNLTVYSACKYHEGGIREEIHKLKYGGATRLCWYMGRHMAEKFGECSADYLLPVPLHLHSERGYNQCVKLAEGMCDLWDAEILDAAVWTRDVPRRATSNERHDLKPSDFGITQNIERKRIALVDDVCTSGMTLSCLAEACRINGADVVCAYTLAGA